MNDMASTLWLTGLSGAGKTSLAKALQVALQQESVGVYVLDGDVLRTGLCRDLGFSPQDRSENIRRAAEVAKVLNDVGVTAVAALISPLAADREMARALIGEQRFFEVHIATSLTVCEQRDIKGLYRRARAGELPDFTGVSAPYEIPAEPHLRLDLGVLSLDEAVAICLRQLRQFSA